MAGFALTHFGEPQKSLSMPKGAKKNPRQFNSIDLFAGAGGLSAGLQMAGFKTLFANEISPAYAETLKQNHPETKVLTEDIRQASAVDVMRELGVAKGELDLVAGGPPCQGFSINAPIRSTGDSRNHLFLEFLRFVEEFQPKCVMIENVPGMVSFNSGETVRAIITRLQRLGYSTAVRVVYAAHFGVPQMRWRTIFLGTRLDFEPLLLYPEVSHKALGRANFTTKLDGMSLVSSNEEIERVARLPFTTVDQAISDLPPIDNGGGSQKSAYTGKPSSEFQRELRKLSKWVFNHECAGIAKTNIERLKHIPQGGSWRDIPFELLPVGMKRARRSDHTKRYGRLDPKGIASTILTKCDPHWGAYFHPTQNRVLSVREAARLQSFPDHIRFFGSLTDQYKQVGNAVPPLLACAFGKRIISCLHAYEEGRSPPPTTVAQNIQSTLQFE